MSSRTFNSKLQTMHLQTQLDKSPMMSIVTEDSRKAVKAELTRMWHEGCSEKARTVTSMLKTLEANLDNDKLDLDAFRQLTHTVVDLIKEECHPDNC